MTATEALMGAPLTKPEALHYSRHLIVPELGMDGQRRLKGARVLLVGAGGLGSPAGLYLAAAGIGRIGVVEFDQVETSNLQRQILYTTHDVGRPKGTAAAERLRAMNPHVEVVHHSERLDADNALGLFADYDVVVDGTDNFPTRYLVNDACVLAGKPNVYASVFRFEGQLSVFNADGGACYRCLYPAPPPAGFAPSCAEAGVLGVLPGLLGVLQATEVVKLIAGIGRPMVNRLLRVDALDMQFRELRIARDPDCDVCGDRPVEVGLIDYPAFCDAATAVDDPAAVPLVSPAWLSERLQRAERLQLIDVREPHEFEIVRIEGARLVPLGTLNEAVGSFDGDVPLVCYCKSGARSLQAAQLLQRRGMVNVFNLDGGINAWVRDVAPEALTY